MLKNRNVIIVAHKYLTQPDDDLVIYLNKAKNPSVMHIGHSFYETGLNGNTCKVFKNGELSKTVIIPNTKYLPELFVYFKEVFLTTLWIFKYRKEKSIYIGMDGFCVFVGLMCKSLGLVDTVIYWATDFVPKNRFNEKWKNWFYKTINHTSYLKADEVWDLSPRMRQARKDYLDISEDAYKSQKVVPYGAWINRIPHYAYDDCEKNTLVFMGHLLEKQGVQLVLNAMPMLIERIPNIKFLIIGTGNYEKPLKELAEKLGVMSHCEFTGKIDEDEELEKRLATSCVGIAPYIKKLDRWTYYADPGKVKKYLACGLPVVLTDLPWNSQDIVASKCGIIITEDLNALCDAVEYLFKRENNIEYRENAKKYSQSFSYEDIFEKL